MQPVNYAMQAVICHCQNRPSSPSSLLKRMVSSTDVIAPMPNILTDRTWLLQVYRGAGHQEQNEHEQSRSL